MFVNKTLVFEQETAFTVKSATGFVYTIIFETDAGVDPHAFEIVSLTVNCELGQADVV